MRTCLWGAAALGLSLAAGRAGWGDELIEQEPIRYLSAEAHDPVTRLQGRIDRGEVALDFDAGGSGYLKSVLTHLGVSPTSQGLVFSKTSVQQSRISPRTPRAVYFGDDAYVAFVRGGDVLEISAVDPALGATFYRLDQRKADRPVFERQTHACLQCHDSSKTQDVPGHLVRSVFAAKNGEPVFRAGSFVTDPSSPMEQRWGGWYVTGTHGARRHMGNAFATDRDDPRRLDTEAGANRTTLKGLVDTRAYTTGHSDIVALMVLEHQTQAHNLMTLAGYQTRIGRHYDRGINKALGRPDDEVSEGTERRIKSHADRLVAALLFAGEDPITDPVAGTSGYAEQFAARGPRDRRGRSLRDFDLKTRLFRYPCSYLIYSEAFDALPGPMKAAVYERLKGVLTGRDTRPEFAHLSPADRRAILEILLDTKAGLPDDWKELASPGP